jgi:hypothetical protein
LVPGQDLYFRVKSGAGSFASNAFFLDIPAQPASPSFAIDFHTENTSSVIENAFEYANNPELSDAITGDGMAVSLTPGVPVFFRQKATLSQFASGIQALTVPARPVPPVISIDYADELSVENISPDIEYSLLPDMTGSQPGENERISLLPGGDYFFRKKPTDASFASGLFHLEVIERPLITSAVNDTLTDESFTATVDFHSEATGFEADDIAATNADITLIDPQTIKIDPVEEGLLTLTIKANSILSGNFASDMLAVYYTLLPTSVNDPESQEASLLVYPAPVRSFLTIRTGNGLALPCEIMLINSNGSVARRVTMSDNQLTLDLNDLPGGFYILKAVDATGQIRNRKIIRQ